jgi:UDP-glucose:(heptosyl)LPS alpha-1,3-glucosyltransferase
MQRSAARNGRGLKESDFVLLLIGNDWRVKGLPCVLKAMQAVDSASLRLLVVGGENPARYLEEAKQLGIADRVRFESSNPNVLELYAAADLYVSPSLEDSFGLPVLEAMACGLPVVTSPAAGVSQLISNELNGFVLEDPRSIHELAKLLNKLLPDLTRRKQIGVAASRVALNCNWDQNAAAIFRLLRDASK